MSSDYDNFITLPSLREAATKKLAAAIEEAIEVFCDEGPMYRPPRALSYVVSRKLKLTSKACIDAVAASLDDVIKMEKVSSAVIRRCARRLAVNVNRLAQGWSCPYAPMTVPEHWAMCEIEGFERFKKGQEWRVKIAYRILTGRLAGRRYIDVMKSQAVSFLYGVCTGYPRKCGYQTPRQLMFLRCVLRLSMHDESINCVGYGITKPFRASNIKLTRSRVRNISTCPFGSALDCVNCPVGSNECNRSVLSISTHLVRKTREDSRAVT